jgi:hypothetical protein
MHYTHFVLFNYNFLQKGTTNVVFLRFSVVDVKKILFQIYFFWLGTEGWSDIEGFFQCLSNSHPLETVFYAVTPQITHVQKSEKDSSSSASKDSNVNAISKDTTITASHQFALQLPFYFSLQNKLLLCPSI